MIKWRCDESSDQRKYKQKFGNIDNVDINENKGMCSKNVENTARRYFKHPEITVQITILDVTLIRI